MILFLIMSTLGLNVVQSQVVPDPMGNPASKKQTGLDPKSNSQEKGALTVRGIISVENRSEVNPKNNFLNMVIVNDKHYKVGNLIENEWKVISIAKRKVVLTNVKTKETKVFNFTGDQP